MEDETVDNTKKGRLITQTVGDVTVVDFVDSRILDENIIKIVVEELFALVNNSYKIKLIIDFQNVDYLSSAVLGKLVALKKLVDEAKGQVKLCNIKPSIRQIFSITKLDKLIEIQADQAAAMKAMQKGRFV